MCRFSPLFLWFISEMEHLKGEGRMLKWEKRNWWLCADCPLVVFQMQRYNISKAVCHLLSFSIVKIQENGCVKCCILKYYMP